VLLVHDLALDFADFCNVFFW